MTSAQNRSIPIDCLRAFAVLWVLGYHFVPLTTFRQGTYGVLLFFIISGYCISFSAETSHSAWRFYSKRLGRLLPALIVCGFVTTAFKAVAPELTDPVRLMSWWEYAYTLIALPTLNALRVNYKQPDGAYWSLIVEFQFYFICFAIMAIGMRQHLLKALCIFVMFRTLTTSLGQSSSNDFFPFFIAGMSIAALIEGRSKDALFGFCTALGVELYHLYFEFPQPSVAIEGSRTVLLLAGTAAVYLAASYQPVRTVERLLSPVAFIGLISYPLYLIHKDVGNMILRWGHVDYTYVGAPLYIRSFAIPGLMIFIAWLVYFFVERRCIKPLTDTLTDPYGALTRPAQTDVPLREIAG